MTLTDRPEDAAESFTQTAPVTTPLLAPTYRWATIGMVSLVFLAAFEALAVTTIMPSVSADLDGRAWFSAAFSATLAASVVGMVAGGLWSDRTGPRLPLLASVAVFAGGLLLAGLAPGIELFVAARFLQGLGGGAMTVALYVVVARIYAPIDHPRIFGAFAAAWVIPSMVGPSIAGAVLEAFGWRWVFLGVVALAFAATALLLPALRTLLDNPEPSTVATAGRLALATVVALAVVALDLAGRASALIGMAVAVAALVVVLVAVRPLLPPGTLVVRRGLPAVIALRGAIAATFFATEIYLPYLLQEQYGVSPWLSGATLTVGALGWSASSAVQARLGARLDHLTALRVGAGAAARRSGRRARRDRAPADAGPPGCRLGGRRGRDGPDVPAHLVVRARCLDGARAGWQLRRDVDLRRRGRRDGDLAGRPGVHRRRHGGRPLGVRRRTVPDHRAGGGRAARLAAYRLIGQTPSAATNTSTSVVGASSACAVASGRRPLSTSRAAAR